MLVKNYHKISRLNKKHYKPFLLSIAILFFANSAKAIEDSNSINGLSLKAMELVKEPWNESSFGKSLYVNMHENNGFVNAYKSQGENLQYQTTSNCPRTGPTGLALDPCSGYAFLTYEDSSCVDLFNAKAMGVPKVFGLTLKPQFFEKLGFKVVDKNLLPMKVWSDCARCTKQQNCDETAVIKLLDGACCPLKQ